MNASAARPAQPSPRRSPSRLWPRWLLWGVAAAAGLLAVPGAALIRFANPVADEFDLLANAHDGWMHVVQIEYMNWNGRWAGVAVWAFGLMHVPLEGGYRLLLALMIGVQIPGLAALWRALLGAGSTLPRILVLALASLGVLWALSPAPGEIYYWYIGAAIYQLPLTLALLTLGFAALALAPSRRAVGRASRTICLALAAAGAAITPGAHEAMGATLCLILLAGGAAARRQSRAVAPWALLLSFALAGTLVSVLAPGDYHRAATFAEPRSLGHAILKTGYELETDVLPWLASPLFWTALLVAMLGPASIFRRPRWMRGRGVHWPALVLGLTAAAAGFWILFPTYVMGGANGRLLAITHQIVCLGSLVAALAWRPRALALLRRLAPAARRRIVLALALAFIASAWLTGNAPRAVGGWRQAAQWDREMTAQRTQARAAHTAGTLDATVPRIATPLPLFFFSDGITDNPNDWTNKAFAAYYGLRSIRVRAEINR